MNTHLATISFGRYAGERLVRLPVSYLRRAVNENIDGPVRLDNGNVVPLCRAAQAELDRRGSEAPAVEITAHAIDRLTERYLRVYERSCEPGEGLFTWATRVVQSALLRVMDGGGALKGIDEVTLQHEGIRFVVSLDKATPVVVTVK